MAKATKNATPKYLTLIEAAQLIGRSWGCVYRWARVGAGYGLPPLRTIEVCTIAAAAELGISIDHLGVALVTEADLTAYAEAISAAKRARRRPTAAATT